MEQFGAVTCSKAADDMANSVDPDQTAPSGAVWSGSALFAQPCLSEYLECQCKFGLTILDSVSGT